MGKKGEKKLAFRPVQLPIMRKPGEKKKKRTPERKKGWAPAAFAVFEGEHRLCRILGKKERKTQGGEGEGKKSGKKKKKKKKRFGELLQIFTARPGSVRARARGRWKGKREEKKGARAKPLPPWFIAMGPDAGITNGGKSRKKKRKKVQPEQPNDVARTEHLKGGKNKKKGEEEKKLGASAVWLCAGGRCTVGGGEREGGGEKKKRKGGRNRPYVVAMHAASCPPRWEKGKKKAQGGKKGNRHFSGREFDPGRRVGDRQERKKEKKNLQKKGRSHAYPLHCIEERGGKKGERKRAMDGIPHCIAISYRV